MPGDGAATEYRPQGEPQRDAQCQMFEETGGIRMGITYRNFFFARPNKKVPKRPKRHLENLEKKHHRSSKCLSLKKGGCYDYSPAKRGKAGHPLQSSIGIARNKHGTTNKDGDFKKHGSLSNKSKRYDTEMMLRGVLLGCYWGDYGQYQPSNRTN